MRVVDDRVPADSGSDQEKVDSMSVYTWNLKKELEQMVVYALEREQKQNENGHNVLLLPLVSS